MLCSDPILFQPVCFKTRRFHLEPAGFCCSHAARKQAENAPILRLLEFQAD